MNGTYGNDSHISAYGILFYMKLGYFKIPKDSGTILEFTPIPVKLCMMHLWRRTDLIGVKCPAIHRSHLKSEMPRECLTSKLLCFILGTKAFTENEYIVT